MADRFDKFTERARRVLTLAQEEAQRFNHSYLGTEHLLLGLIRERDGVAAKVLSNLGVELSKVRSAVEFIIGRGETPSRGEIGLTDRAKKVLHLSIEEARRLNHSYIGTEHLLLGIVREGEGIAFGVLESLGVTLERVRTETARVLAIDEPSTGQQAIGVDEAQTAVEEAIAAIDALGSSDLANDLSRSLLLPLLHLINRDLYVLTESNVPVGYNLEVRRQLQDRLLLLHEAASVFERHNLEPVASLLKKAVTEVGAVIG